MEQKAQRLRHKWEIATWVLGLLITILIVLWLNFELVWPPMTSGNSTLTLPWVRQPDRPGAQILPDILPSVAAVLGTVFSIAFAFSLFIIPNIADRYSPRMVSFFTKSRKYRAAYLGLFIFVVTAISLLLVVRILNSAQSLVVASLTVIMFTLGLVIFLRYYTYIYDVVDPRSFSILVENEITLSLDRVAEAKNGLAALADSAIKALNRGGEVENAKTFIDSLANVTLRIVRAGPNDVPGRELTSHLMEEFSRIHNAAQKKGETTVTRHIYLKMRDIGVELVETI
jgi:uncharacterized membrane protein